MSEFSDKVQGKVLEKVQIDPLAFRRRQVEMLYGQLPLVLLANIVVGAVLFGVLFSSYQSAAGLVWVVMLMTTTVIRVLLTLQQRKTPGRVNTDTRVLVAGSLITGIIWGCAWLLLPPEADFNQVLLLGVFLACMQAGAVTTTTILMPMFLAYSIPASLLFLAYIFFALDQNQALIGGSYTMYLFFVLAIAYRINRDFCKTIDLQIHNEALMDSLQREAASLNNKERELAQQLEKGQLLQSEKDVANSRLEDASTEKNLLLESLHEGVFGLDEHGNITFTNASAQRILRRDKEELRGLAVQRIIKTGDSEDDNSAPATLIKACYQDGREIHDIEAQLRGGEASNIPVTLSCVPLRKKDQVVGAVLSFLDNRRHKEMEAILRQSQKMEAIGRLTGGVAHDFNNLITVILGNMQFLKKHVADDKQAQLLIDRISNAARSGGELNNRLLSFSREQALEKDLINVADLLEEMREFLGRLLGEDINLEIDPGDSQWAVVTDRTQLQNAILNICVNARDAMPGGGRLKITTDITRLPLSPVNGQASRTEADFLEISITDNGEGIPAEVQKQIFEPFFSTKQKGRGTGLGLATVYGFIRQSGGNITVNSRVGEWTRFRIYLPLADKAARPQPTPPLQPAQSGPLKGTVLVVEDDPNVRDVAIHSLEEAGYSVVSAGNGEAALERLRKHPEIELVFSDIIMPGRINGIELAEAILAQYPDMPIILATGYTDKTLKDKLGDVPNVLFISKPYDTETLPELIRSLPARKAS